MLMLISFGGGGGGGGGEVGESLLTCLVKSTPHLSRKRKHKPQHERSLCSTAT